MRQMTFKLSAMDCLEPMHIEEYAQKVFAASRNFLGHFEVILFKSQKAFVRRHQVLQDGKMSLFTKAFCDLNKITSKWPKKVSRCCKNFLSILLNIPGFQAIHGRKFECHLTHRRKYFKRKVGQVEVLDLVSGAHV